MSNVDISETVDVRNAILSALKPVSGTLQTYFAELAYSSKCNLLSEYCGQKSKNCGSLWITCEQLKTGN